MKKRKDTKEDKKNRLQPQPIYKEITSTNRQSRVVLVSFTVQLLKS